MNKRLSAHLIRPGDLNPGWVLLYVVTWALQWFSAPFRYFAALLVLVIVNAIAGWNLPDHYLALVVGFGPLVISLATLVLPLGGWWFQQQQGGRRASERERAVFEAAFEQLRGADPRLRPPRRWFVTDDPEPNACAYADTLMVTRGILEDPSFPAVLAHELGHLNTSDARVTAAVYRITTPPREPVGFPFRLLAFLISGRIGMALVKTPWAIYWRRREAVADSYAARLGQGPALASYLDTHALAGDLPIPFKDFGDTSHPWTEHRIDDLEAD
ncbi:MAG TPA: M48 family metalloprotease [Solirubrobacterales bacterium]|nr:M48 family metalloprotease [Solirubrobacterales bacterium]